MRGRLGRGQGGHPGGTPLPRPPRNLPRAPTGPWNQESPAPGPNSNQMAQVENHCARRGRAGNWRLRVPGVCAVHGEAESTSTPPHKHHGVLGPRTRGWGCRRPSGGMRTGAGRSGFPGSPLGRPSCPGPTFSWPGSLREFQPAFSRQEQAAPRSCVGASVGILKGPWKESSPCTCPGAAGLCPGGTEEPAVPAQVQTSTGGGRADCSLRAQLAWGGAGGGSGMLKLRPRLG